MTGPLTTPDAGSSGASQGVSSDPPPATGTNGSVPSSTPSAAPRALSATALKSLGVALACEQAAVWSYGLVAAHLGKDLALISSIRAGHLARRDATAAAIVAGHGRAAAPAAAYAVPAVADAAGARALAATLETECAQAWHSVLGNTDDPALRTAAYAGLSDSAVWLTQLKIAGKITPSTVAFPGRP